MPAGPAPAPWQAWPDGLFTGTRWDREGAMEGQDPYLPWAEADRFRAYQFHGRCRPDWLPVIIELHEGVEVIDLVRASSTRWLQVPRSYLGWPGLRFCTARVARGFFSAMGRQTALSRLVRRYELGLPVEHHTGALADPATGDSAAPERRGLLQGPVLGLIDGGLALAHSDFLDAHGRPRVRHFWRQDSQWGSRWPGDCAGVRRPLDPARAGTTPPDMGYGHALGGDEIARAMAACTRGGLVDEEALYRRLQLWDLDHAAHHGTHVLSQACAPRRYTDAVADAGLPARFHRLHDPASRCPVIAVALDWANVLDTSGGAMNVSVLDGLMYMLGRCAPRSHLVVNISWGTLAGPHDGSSILEAAMDQLIELRHGHLQIVVPAGNAYQSRTHAHAELAPGDAVTLHWRVQPDDHTQSFLELWMCDPALPTEPLRDLSIEVRPPGMTTLPPMTVGQSGLWPSAGEALCGLVFPRRSALGRQGSCALLALAPTASWHPGVTTGPCGVWTVTVRNDGLNPVVLDAVIERDDIAMGTYTGARQSYFEDESYDPQSTVDDPAKPTPVRRSGSFNSLSTGARTVAVGGVRRASSAFDPAAAYSPRLPDPDEGRASRPGVKKLPDRLAIADDSAALPGIRGAGSRSGGTVRLVGTSSAAPQIARELLNRSA